MATVMKQSCGLRTTLLLHDSGHHDASLMLAAELPCKGDEFLPASTVLVLVSTHSTPVTATLVNLIKLWGLEQQHDQLETLQLLSCPFCTLFRVAVLAYD